MEDMINYYKTFFLSTGSYDCLVICLSYESIFSYINDLQADLKNNGLSEGNILLDQLLIAGNGKNRFLSIKFKEKQFDLTTAKNVSADLYYRQLTSCELKKNITMLENSILTPKQISLIARGCVI